MSETIDNNLSQSESEDNPQAQIKTIENLEKPAEQKKEEKVMIHTMPKRFLKLNVGSDKAKNVGVLIMVGGTVFLIAVAGFLYFFLLKPTMDESAKVEQTVDTAVTKPENTQTQSTSKTENTKTEQQVKTSSENPPEVVKLEEEEVKTEEASSSSEVMIEPEPEEATTTEEVIAPKPEIKAALDTDKDGLSDAEERLFGTNISSKDSDGDGFEDLSEILSLYNPSGEGKIIINSNIEKYTNNKYSYSVYYLKSQTVEQVGGGEDSVIFKMDNGHFIQIVITQNPEKKTIDDWYKEQFSVNYVRNEQRVYKTGWTGVKSDDGLVVYLAHPSNNNIYVVSYFPGSDYILNYKNVFEMMVNSLELK